jgi:hypothetical protein
MTGMIPRFIGANDGALRLTVFLNCIENVWCTERYLAFPPRVIIHGESESSRTETDFSPTWRRGQ